MTERRGGSFSIFTVLLSVTLSVGVTIGLFYLRDAGGLDFGGGSTTVAVPDLEGLDSARAGERLVEDGLRLAVEGEEPSADVDEGAVLSQRPRPGSSIERGATVSVTLSSGVPDTRIPDVVGMTVDAARRAIVTAGFVVGSVDETGDGEPGTVTAVEPAAGSVAEEGDAVWLTAVPAGVQVPDVTGKSRRRAEEELREAGLAVGDTRRGYHEDRPPYIVLEQEPAAGQTVARGTAIALTINE